MPAKFKPLYSELEIGSIVRYRREYLKKFPSCKDVTGTILSRRERDGMVPSIRVQWGLDGLSEILADNIELAWRNCSARRYETPHNPIHLADRLEVYAPAKTRSVIIAR